MGTHKHLLRGASNEYPQHMFSSRNKKTIIWIPLLICSCAGQVEHLENSSHMGSHMGGGNCVVYFRGLVFCNLSDKWVSMKLF